MTIFTLTFLRGGQFDRTMPVRYVHINRLLATQPETEQSYKDLLGQVEGYIDNGTPVAEWEPVSCDRLVLMACALVRGELAKAEASGKTIADMPIVLGLADWLCSLADANVGVSACAREQVAGLWVWTQVSAAGPCQEVESAAGAAAAALAPLNLPQDDLISQVRAQLVLHVARQHAAGTAPPDAVEIARRWRDELSRVPQMAAFLGRVAEGLGVSPPPPALPPMISVTPAEDQNPAGPLATPTQHDRPQEKQLEFLRDGQFDRTVPARYVHMNRLLATQPETEQRYNDLLGQVEGYLDNGTPVAEWEPVSCDRFVLMACALVRGELANADASGKKIADMPNVLGLADWLCSLAVANVGVSACAREQVAGLWVWTQASAAGPCQGVESAAAAAASALAPLNLPQDDLTSQVRAQLVLHVARQQATGTASPEAVETARRWRDELSRVPQMAAFLGSIAEGLGVSPPPPALPPIISVTPAEDQNPAGPLATPPQHDRSEVKQLECSPDSQPADTENSGAAEPVNPADISDSVTNGPAEQSSTRGRRRRLGHWDSHFRSDTDLIDGFPAMADELLPLVQELVRENKLPRRAEQDLTLARKQYESFKNRTGDRSSNMFLIPAMKPAAAAAEALTKADRREAAFAIANEFGEACKVLIGQSRDRKEEFLDLLEWLLLAACAAAAVPPVSDPDRPSRPDAEGEIAGMQRRLKNLCGFALGTYYDFRQRRFLKSRLPETPRIERVVNTTLAQYFDTRLTHLLTFDRPRVKEFVMTNWRAVCDLELSEEWTSKRQGWERKLIEAGQEETLRFLKDMGVVRKDQLGQVSPEDIDEIHRYASNDLNRVQELLKGCAKELKDHLYSEAQKRLDYRPPPKPQFRDVRSERTFQSCERLSKGRDPAKLREALEISQELLRLDIDNLVLRDWVAFLRARNSNTLAAERELEQIRKRRDSRHNFSTDWNLAVIAYDRKDEKRVYNLLVPLLEHREADDDLFLVVMALSLKLNEPDRFLLTIPRIMNLRFHPLAFTVAHDQRDEVRAKALLGELLNYWENPFELPDINEQFRPAEFDDIVAQAIAQGQLDQLVAWLQARIQAQRKYVPNYLALAGVLEKEKQDVAGAHRVLQDRLGVERKKKRVDQRQVDMACRDLLELCKRHNKLDLGQRAYDQACKAHANEALLRSFAIFAPKGDQPPGPEEQELDDNGRDEQRDEQEPSLKDPKLEQLVWFNATLTNVRDVASYVKEARAFAEFAEIVEQIPQAGSTVVQLIRMISGVIEQFATTKADEKISRRSLYEQAVGFEKDLAELLRPGVLSQRVVAVLTPYRQALERVVGDLSRLVGIAPNVQASIVNKFMSPEADQSTLVLRIENTSERPITDVFVEVSSETPAFLVPERRARQVAKLAAKESTLLCVPVNRGRLSNPAGGEAVFPALLKASAEGFTNQNLGTTKLRVPMQRFVDAFGLDEIPKLFQIGRPLKLTEPELFQGRSDILNKVKGSFHGGIQRESYFLDGIRRAGKTSILHFLPSYLPEHLVPVLINLDDFGLSGPMNSASVLRDLCRTVAESTRTMGNIPATPSLSEFQADPRQMFDAFLASLEKALAGRFPFLMIDEFQDLLQAISRTGTEKNRDTLVLDLLRSRLENGRLNAIFTGSVRFDRLSNIMNHRIFGSITPLRVSFLSRDSVAKVLEAGMGQWVALPRETVDKIYELTGGYPWLVQTYGSHLVDLVNRERRAVVSPEDAEVITQEVLCNDKLFSFWWPTEQLGADEERFIDLLFRKFPGQPPSFQEFLGHVNSRDHMPFQTAYQNLRACEVLDSTQTQLRFRGSVLREWLKRQAGPNGQIRVRVAPTLARDTGHAGIFIDHENLIRTLDKIQARRGSPPTDRLEWFKAVLGKLVEEAKHRIGDLKYKVTVAFWSRPHEGMLLPAYFHFGFDPKQPAEVKLENAVDFTVADEVRRAREGSLRENSSLGRAVVVSGDGDLSHAVRALVNDGVAVQIWGGSRETCAKYVEIVGSENVIVLDDVCGL
jgi:hypothetical protein